MNNQSAEVTQVLAEARQSINEYLDDMKTALAELAEVYPEVAKESLNIFTAMGDFYNNHDEMEPGQFALGLALAIEQANTVH